MYDEAVEELKAVKEAKILKFGEFSKQMADFYKQLGEFYGKLIHYRTNMCNISYQQKVNCPILCPNSVPTPPRPFTFLPGYLHIIN